MNHTRRQQRHKRIRARLRGTKLRPRAALFRSLTSMTVQLIDDEGGRTLIGVTARRKKGVSKMQQAQEAGRAAAAAAKKAGITKIAFDRGGFLYHGRVKAVAEAMREGGLQF